MKALTTDRTERKGIGIAIDTFESLDFAFREQAVSDYGIDAHVELIDQEKATGQLLGVQLKSGISYFSEVVDGGYVFRSNKKHIDYWLNHALPILICLCDVDRKEIYWQIVNPQTVISTGKDYKIIIPSGRRIDVSSQGELRDLLTPIVAVGRYTLFNTDDVSHVGAKRYVFKAVITGSASKSEVAAIVRYLTNVEAKRRYHRNDMSAGRWGDSDADVVWTFIYPSAEDYTQNNYICRSIWIQEDLADIFRPNSFNGENIGDSVIVDWNENYEFYAKHAADNTLTKEDYLSAVLPIVDRLKGVFMKIQSSLEMLKRKGIIEKVFIETNSPLLVEVNEAYFEITDLAIAPYECREIDEKLQNFAALFHNIYVLYSENAIGKYDEASRLYQAYSYCVSSQEELRGLNYELKKIR